MVASSQSTVWAQLAGIVGAAGGVVFLDTDNTTPVIDVNNLFWDDNDVQLFLGFNYTGGGLSRYGAGANAGLLVEYGIDAYLQQDKQSASLYAEHSVSTSRGTPTVPVLSQDGDLIGRFTARAYSGATPAFNVFGAIDWYVSGATAANLGSTLVLSTKSDGGALTEALRIDENQAVTLAGDLDIGGNFTINGLLTTTALGFTLGVLVPDEGFAVTSANTIRAYINGVAKWTLTSTGLSIAGDLDVTGALTLGTVLAAAEGGTGLATSGVTAGWVLTADGVGGWTVAAAPGAGSVPDTRLISAGTGLTGGGDLSADRTLALATIADQRMFGNISGGVAAPSAMTAAQVTAFVSAFVGDAGAGGTKGSVPAPAAGDAAANKYLKADGTWATVQTPGLVLLATVSAAASATIDFTANINNTYDEYELHLVNVKPATNDVGLYLRVSEDAGASWKAGAADYVTAAQYYTNAGVASFGSTGAAFMQLAYVGGTAGIANAVAAIGYSAIIKVFQPAGTAQRKGFTLLGNYEPAAGGNYAVTAGMGYIGTVNAINGLRILASSGNITSGFFALYGVKKA